MGIFTGKQDAHGRAMYDCHMGRASWAVIERDDGYVDLDNPPGYFLPAEKWSQHERQGVAFARGRVLDVGCGAGRVALHLQRNGLDVTGIDNSPLAVRLCRRRGLRKVRLMPLSLVHRALGTFDTVLLYGNNFGLLENARRARWLLRRFHRMTSLPGRIIAATNDPYRTDNPSHLAYHKRNRARGRMAGQARIRVRYRDLATPYFDYLMVSREEIRQIVAGTGWRIAQFLDSGGSTYIAVMEKEAAS